MSRALNVASLALHDAKRRVCGCFLPEGRTALMLAATHGRAECLQELLQRDADKAQFGGSV